MRYKLFESQAKAKEVLKHNEPRLIRAGNKEVCIVRVKEELFAFQNECSHMGERLHRGSVNYLKEIVCPLHTYRFSICTGEESQQRCGAIKTYSIIEEPDGIYVDC